MSTLAFLLLTTMIALYVLLDGYDLGVGALSLFVARSDREREATRASIGPYWNGNEVWLIAAGGALFALFPVAYASAFSGFYLPFTMVLWLLMARGIAFELRSHFASDMWRGFWDVTFAVSSMLLVFLFGVAFGNIVRGLPLDADHYFRGSLALLLNPYALLVGVFAVGALAQHGAAYLMMRVDGATATRSERAANVLWWFVMSGYVATTLATFAVRSIAVLHANPFFVLAPVLTLGGLIWFRIALAKHDGTKTFAASSLFIAGLLGSGATSIYPYLLPGYPIASTGLSILQASPSPVALATSLSVTIVGLVAVAIYTLLIVRRLSAKPTLP